MPGGQLPLGITVLGANYILSNAVKDGIAAGIRQFGVRFGLCALGIYPPAGVI
jgi:hypothetical protein